MWHYIGKNHSTTFPAAHVAVDCECYYQDGLSPGEYQIQMLRCWCATYWRQEGNLVTRRDAVMGTDAASFWNWLEKKLDQRRILHVWAHNAAYDLTALQLWSWMADGHYMLLEPRWRLLRRREKNPKSPQRQGFIADGDPPTIVHLWHQNGCQVQFLDTLNWFREQLSKLGEKVGLKKYPMPLTDMPINDWQVYCMRDCEIVEKTVQAISSFIQRHDCGVFKATAPGQSMASYRHRFAYEKLCFHDEYDVKMLERKCYYGGRVDPFYIGCIARNDLATIDSRHSPSLSPYATPLGPIYHLDTTALFPSVMHSGLFPSRLDCWETEGMGQWMPSIKEAERMCAHVLIYTEQESYPIHTEGDTIWCKGKIDTYLCGEELANAVARRHVKYIKEWSIYDTAELFTNFVDYWWQQRLEAEDRNDPCEAALCKLIMNSLYGKFGERRKRWETQIDRRAYCAWGVYLRNHEQTGEVLRCRGIDGVEQIEGIPEEIDRNFPAICAFITAAARLRMDYFREIAYASDVYYQGIDSLYVSQSGYERLFNAGCVKERSMGYLRLMEIYDTMHIHGCHDYKCDDKITRGGVSKTMRVDTIGREIQERFQSLAGVLADGPTLGPKVTTEEVGKRQPFTRGKLTPTGRIIPLVREDW